MAEEDELELDTAQKKSGGKGKVIILLVVVVLLVSGIVIGALYFTGALGSSGKGKTESVNKAQPDEKSTQKPVENKPASYLDLSPAFIVNFQDKTKATYLQVEMQVMTREPSVLDVMKNHMPLIRNDILLILSSQNFDGVKTRQGKETLQQTILEKIRSIVGAEMQKQVTAENEGKKVDVVSLPNVEQVYFTSFIMQ